MDLFGNETEITITKEDIERISANLPDGLGVWLVDALKRKRLSQLLGAFIQTGRARNAEGSLQYLIDWSRSQTVVPNLITMRDVRRKNTAHSFLRLDRFMERSVEREGANWARRIGIHSHGVFFKRLAGEIRPARKITPSQLSLWAPLTEQIDLLAMVSIPDGDDWRLYFTGTEGRKRLAEIRSLWKEMSKEVAASASWAAQYHRLLPHVYEMAELLVPAFGGDLIPLMRVKGAWGDYLSILALMSWAAGLIEFARSEPKILFREIRAIDPVHGLSGGRIDAVEVASLDGKRLTRSQKRLLSQMARGRWRSVDDLVTNIRNLLGKFPDLTIWDAKFAVGDGVGRTKIIRPHQFEDPPRSHTDQVKEYADYISLDSRLKGAGHADASAMISHANLLYFPATSHPLTHGVPLEIKSNGEAAHELANKWEKIKNQALIRAWYSQVVGHALELLSGRANKGSTRKVLASPDLFTDDEVPSLSIERLITKLG